MPITVNGPSRSTRIDGGCASEPPTPIAPLGQGQQVVDGIDTAAIPGGALIGARGRAAPPPMPGPAMAADFPQDVGLDRIGDVDDDPAAASAIRTALGMSDSAPLNNKTIGAALQQQTPQVLQSLRDLGLSPGTSLTDPKTIDAIQQVQEALGVPTTGSLDLETLMALVQASNDRNTAAKASQSAGSSGGGEAGEAGGASASNASNDDASEGGADAAASSAGLSDLGVRRPPQQADRSTIEKAQDFAKDTIGVGPGSAPTGSLRANQQEAYAAAIKEGLSPTAAKALVANMTGESLAKPNDHHWDVSHMSQGIVQWDPSRAAAIKKEFGKLPKDMTVAEQTKAAIWEMQNKYPKTWEALQGSDPKAMMSALVRDYERPANPSGEIAKRMQHYNALSF